MPATYDNSDGLAVFASTPTEFTHDSTSRSSAFFNSRLINIMLILADADGLRIDLDEFCQRILQTMGDADRAANRHIQIGYSSMAVSLAE